MTNNIYKAMDILRGNWTKGIEQDEEGRVCGLGALNLAAGRQVTEHIPEGDFNSDYELHWTPEADLMRDTAKEFYPERFTSPYNIPYIYGTFAVFNDHNETTEDEVLSVMEKAAIKWDERA